MIHHIIIKILKENLLKTQVIFYKLVEITKLLYSLKYLGKILDRWSHQK